MTKDEKKNEANLYCIHVFEFNYHVRVAFNPSVLPMSTEKKNEAGLIGNDINIE